MMQISNLLRCYISERYIEHETLKLQRNLIVLSTDLCYRILAEFQSEKVGNK